MDVALFIASWKEVLKGLGVRGKGAPGLPRVGTLADDGKRLGLSESALDVASAMVKNFLN